MHILTGLFLGEMLMGSGLLGDNDQRRLAFELIHSLPGRVRFRVPLMKGDEVMAGRLVSQLGAVDGVLNVVADRRTGSVLTLFKDKKSTREAMVKRLDEIVSAAEKSARSRPAAGKPLLRQSIQRKTGLMNREVLEGTGGMTDLSTLLAVAAFILGSKILILPGGTSRWHGLTLLYWSYNMLRRP